VALADQAALAVKLTLDDRQFRQGLTKSQGALKGFASNATRVGRGVGQLGAGFVRAGTIIAGAAIGGLGFAAKKAIDFEDAFAGVRKTVDASDSELSNLYTQLRQLATRIPVQFTDLAEIAQEAGALGVATPDVVGFTDVVARLAAATVGLTPEAAAEAFGKLGNVLFTNAQKADGLVKEYNQMGSALVALGNAGASSEGDIIEVAKRFGAAGRQAGLTAAQVLGFSSAIASLGVEPEAAGSSLSRIFNNITKYLGTGDKKAKAFAETIGITVPQFKKLYAKDATSAVTQFLAKLGKLDRFKASAVLKKAGITNIRDINAILLLSQNTGELTRQLNLSTDAYNKNTELAEVSARRFDTLKNKLATLRNLFFDSAVTVAEGFTPALGRAADKIRALISQPDVQDRLRGIGKDIGDAIDKIDWNAVISGAKEFVGLLKGAGTVALDILKVLNALPGPIKEAGVGFLALNKLSGGLIGQGLGNIVGGLSGAVAKGVAAKIPGVGALVATPVFVTNWPLGGVGGVGGGGGLPILGALGIGAAIVAAAVPLGQALRKELGITFGSQSQEAHTRAIADMQSRGLLPKQPQWPSLTASERSLDQLAAKSKTGFDRDAIESSRIALATQLGQTRGAVISSTYSQTGSIVSAIQNNRPVLNVSVRVAGTSVTTTVTGSTLKDGGGSGPSGVFGPGHGA